jgi:hypothetical protein
MKVIPCMWCFKSVFALRIIIEIITHQVHTRKLNLLTLIPDIYLVNLLADWNFLGHPLNCIALHCTKLHCPALHCTAPSTILPRPAGPARSLSCSAPSTLTSTLTALKSSPSLCITQFKISSSLFVPGVAAHHSQTDTLTACQPPCRGSGALQCSLWMSPGHLETFPDGGQWGIQPGGHVFGSTVVFLESTLV